MLAQRPAAMAAARVSTIELVLLFSFKTKLYSEEISPNCGNVRQLSSQD